MMDHEMYYYWPGKQLKDFHHPAEHVATKGFEILIRVDGIHCGWYTLGWCHAWWESRVKVMWPGGSLYSCNVVWYPSNPCYSSWQQVYKPKPGRPWSWQDKGLYVQWNPSIVAPLNKGQALNKGQLTTMQACYWNLWRQSEYSQG